MARRVTLLLLLAVLVRGLDVGSGRHCSSQRDRDRVTLLPGQPPVTFQHYAGYVDLEDGNQTSLFYWFFEAQEEPMSKPLLLWLNGGPGASSIGFGEAVEMGPFQIRGPDGMLHYNPDSWNTAVNLLFLESPAGVGFSYSNTSDVLDNDVAARHSYEFLLRWFGRFPEYRLSEFYIAGESYAGFYIPELAQVIVRRNEEKKCNSFINLKGILMGNPLLNWETDVKGMVESAWHRGLISSLSYNPIGKGFIDYRKAFDELRELDGIIDVFDVYAKKCNETKIECMPQYPGCKPSFELEHTKYHPCHKALANLYFNRRDVQHALHADGGNKLQPWLALRTDFFYAWHRKTTSVLDILTELFLHNIRIWIYSGDADARLPITSTRYSLAELEKDGMKIMMSWTPWYHEDQVGGWAVAYDRLTFLTVRGAGHMVPACTPKQALRLLNAFLRNESMVGVQ